MPSGITRRRKKASERLQYRTVRRRIPNAGAEVLLEVGLFRLHLAAGQLSVESCSVSGSRAWRALYVLRRIFQGIHEALRMRSNRIPKSKSG